MSMSIHIQDDKKHTVRTYCPDKKIVKAIETLLREMEDVVCAESREGYRVVLVPEDNEYILGERIR